MIADIVKKQGYSTGAFIGGVTLQDSACGLNRNFDVYDDGFNTALKTCHGQERK